MLSLSLRNADNIKWNLSCIQYQSLPDRSAMLARAVAKLYQLTSVLSNVVGSMCFATLVPVSWCHNVFFYYDCMIEIIFMMSQCALYVNVWSQMYNNKQSWILKSWILRISASNYQTCQEQTSNIFAVVGHSKLIEMNKHAGRCPLTVLIINVGRCSPFLVG